MPLVLQRETERRGGTVLGSFGLREYPAIDANYVSSMLMRQVGTRWATTCSSHGGHQTS